MPYFQKSFFVKTSFCCLLLFLFNGCIDPVSPEFEFKEGLIFVEGFVSTSQGASFVAITESALEFGVYVTNFMEGASVAFIKSTSGEVVPLMEQGESYVPPANFIASIGDTWEVEINLPNGTQYRSEPETIDAPVAITGIEATYNPELLFREASGKYTPGHQVLVSFDDPSNRENYYYWSFRSYENLTYCENCGGGIFRNNTCEPAPPTANWRTSYSYVCESDCWKIRFPESIHIFSDKFSNGTAINKLPVADVLLYNKQNIVVEVQQFSLSIPAYEYYKALKDIVDNNGGFNAPLPSVLIGNMYNPSDSEDVIFGRFTAASTTTASVFIERTEIEETQIEFPAVVFIEECETCDAPCPIDCIPVTTAPCSETRYRTAFIPPNWVDVDN